MNPKKLARKVLPKKAIKVAEESYRKSRVYSLHAAHGFPARRLRVIAVTGTNGKTSTASYINAMLKHAGCRTAMFSTAQVELAGVTKLNKTHRTVPLTAELVSFFKQAKAAQVDFVVMEVTSQALDQHKMLGMPVEIAVMTNLTQDHLDYHKTMEAYAAAKARLFNNYCRPSFCVLNADDQWYDYYREVSVGRVVSYGEATQDMQIKAIKLAPSGSDWTLKHAGRSLALHTALPGRFNVQNASAAAAVGLVLGLPLDRVEQGIASLRAVPGRMQKVEAGQPYTVLVDYAHTPDALKNVLEAAQGITKGKVGIVFGATGDRDKSKRAEMGRIVASLADRIYLTDDETYTEDPDTIRRAVYDAIETAGAAGKCQVVADRREAMAKAFQDAGPGDTVVLAGMGHQTDRNMGGRLVPWDEAEIAKNVLN